MYNNDFQHSSEWSWDHLHNWKKIELKMTCSRGLLGLCPVLWSYQARWKGMNLWPVHWASYISSHFSISILCISIGQPDSLAIRISDVTSCPEKCQHLISTINPIGHKIKSFHQLNNSLSRNGTIRFVSVELINPINNQNRQMNSSITSWSIQLSRSSYCKKKTFTNLFNDSQLQI